MTNKVISKNDVHDARSIALGCGAWCIEVVDEDGYVLKEFVGSNGTWNEADDLWADYQEWYNNLP